MKFSKYFDHTGLGPTIDTNKVSSLCTEALQHDFYSVCISEKFVSLCSKLLKNSSVKVCTVIGFPHGADSLESKVFATKNAVKNGAHEIDMVISVADALENNFDEITKEIKSIKEACGLSVVLKVIVETCYLNQEQKKKVCECVKQGGANFIKTSTGFGTDGANSEDIKLFHNELKNTSVQIKASGGIRDLATATLMIESGAHRIGCSQSVAIVNNKKGGVNDTTESGSTY